MITANEAKEIANKANISNLDFISQEIIEAAHEGDLFIKVNNQTVFKNEIQIQNAKKELEKGGFSVKREKGSDQRESNDWDYLIISWE